MKDLIDGGESDPRRIIALLEIWEKRNPLAIDDGSVKSVGGDHGNPQNFPVFPTRFPLYQVVAVDGNFVKVPYYFDRVEFLTDFLAGRKFDAIVELGCGYGQNLVKLYYNGGPRDIPYYGGELTMSGVEATAQISGLLDDLRLVPFHFDHLDPDLSVVKETGNILIFTSHSIEQVKKIPDDYFSRLTGHAERVTGLHFEPFGFQLPSTDDEVSKAQQVQAVVRDWNQNFADVLYASHEKGVIDIKFAGRDLVSDRAPDNPTSIAIWEKLVSAPIP